MLPNSLSAPLHGVLVVVLLEVLYGWETGCALAMGGMAH